MCLSSEKKMMHRKLLTLILLGIPTFFKYVNNQCPNYLIEVFQTAPENNIQTRGIFSKLQCPFCKFSAGQMALFYIGSTIWSKTPDTLKQTKNLNMFKHNLKEQYLKELKNYNFR